MVHVKDALQWIADIVDTVLINLNLVALIDSNNAVYRGHVKEWDRIEVKCKMLDYYHLFLNSNNSRHTSSQR